MNEDKDKNEGNADHIERVRRRAHAIWMDEGQVHGRDHEHWHQAEREIAAETSAHAAPAAAEPQETSRVAAGGSKTSGITPPSPKSATAGSGKTTESPKTESLLRTGP
jgi:Protein of unknown function (DUF2934)